MKVYIDYHKLSIVDVNREKPFYQGSNFIDKIRVLINFKDTNMRPDLTLRLPTGRRIGPLMAIGLEEGESREICENGTNWYYYDFILSSETGALEHYGQLEASVCLNYYDDKGLVKRQAIIGTIVNEVVKTTYLGDNNNIVIIGDNADEVVTDIVNLTSQLANRQDLVDDTCLMSTLLTQAIDITNFNPNGDKLALVFEEGKVYIRDFEGAEIASFSNDEFRANLVSTVRLMVDGDIITNDLETRNLSVGNKIKSKLVPYDDLTYDLGSNVKAWSKLYLDGKGLLMRTNHIKEDGTPVNIRPIRVEDERLVVSTTKDGEEKKAISIAPDKIDIFLPELMNDSSVASLETYGGVTAIRIASTTSDGAIKIDTSCYIKLNGDEQGMIATPNELNIIPELVSGVIPFTLNRIKLGGHEYVAEGQKEDVMFTFKPANSEGQVVPFAITKEGKVYCKGYEIATKNDINNIIGGAPEALDTLIELSKALNNDANFASNVINTITSNYTELNGKLTALSKSLSAANDAIAKEVSDRKEADKTTLDEAKRYTDSELSKGKIQLGSEPYNYIAVENREDGEPLVIHADDCIHLNTVNGGVEVNNDGDLIAYGNVDVEGVLSVNGGAVINGAIDSIELDGSIKFTQNTNNQIKVDEDDNLLIAFDSKAKLGDIVTIDKDSGVEIDGVLYVNGDNITNLIHSNSSAISQEAKDRDEAINNAITKLVNGSPEALDTLLELSEALGNDPNFATTITNALAKKLNISDFNPDNFNDATTWLNHQADRNEVGNSNRPLILYGSEFRTNSGTALASTDDVNNLRSEIANKVDKESDKYLVHNDDIATAHNLNNLRTTGMYYANDLSTNLPPNPNNSYFRLFVNGWQGNTNGGLSQIAINVDDNIMYYRSFANGTWSGWNKVLKDNEVPLLGTLLNNKVQMYCAEMGYNNTDDYKYIYLGTYASSSDATGNDGGFRVEGIIGGWDRDSRTLIDVVASFRGEGYKWRGTISNNIDGRMDIIYTSKHKIYLRIKPKAYYSFNVNIYSLIENYSSCGYTGEVLTSIDGDVQATMTQSEVVTLTPVDNLNSSNVRRPLSANQGRVLNDKLTSKLDKTEFDNLKGSLSAVATSGKYSDLIGVPEGLNGSGLKKTLLYSGAIASNTAPSISALSSNILKTRGLLVFDFVIGVYSGGTFVKQQNTLGSIIISTQDLETLDSRTYYHGTLNYSIPNSYLGGSGSVSENMNNSSQEVGLIALTISYSGQVGFRKSAISGSVSWGSYTPLLTNIWRIE